MIFPIHYLKPILILIAIVFPCTLTGFFISMQKDQRFVLSINSITYLFLILLCIWTGFVEMIQLPDNLLWYLIGIVMGFICIYFEIFIGKFIYYLKTKVWLRKVEIHESVKVKHWLIDIAFILIGALGEEMIFRQILFYITMDIFGWSSIFVLLFSSIIYGLNHIFFSRVAVVQKVFSGVIFSLLFLLSNNSVIIPILAHFTQNLILYILAGSKREGIVWRN